MFRYQLDPDTYLKLIDTRDSYDHFHLIDKNRKHLRDWFAWVDDVISPETYESYMKYSLNEFVEKRMLPVGIWYKGQLAGFCSLADIHPVNRSANFAYYLGEEFQGHGLVTKTVSALMSYAFTGLGLRRIEIRCGTQNAKSRAIPERLGFQQEGTIRQCEWLYDHFIDNAVYGMLASD